MLSTVAAPRPAAIAIRAATRADVPEILAMIRELAAFEKLENEVVATVEGLELTLFGPTSYAQVLLAEAGDAVAGFCLFFHNYSTFLGRPGVYIEDIFIRSRFRGAGMGRKIFAEVARIARDRGCGRIEWWVLDWNTPAIEFYKTMGATPMDDWTVYRLTQDQLDKM
jgi:GNAT superfamily N-acetyltransferase